MNNEVTVVMCCPKCGEFEETGWVTYQRGMRPMCDFCGQTRMVKATEEQEKEYRERND